jgi:pimeloyl-ACP methyl ester carboxylesterase
MPQLAFTRTGAGAPLVLLHALGLSRRVWDLVIPALAERFDVIAVDLPGFGDSAPLPADVEPSPAALAAAVAGLLDELGVTTPHVVGNSLGGWVAVELAAIRPTASVTLLSPAGLWRGDTPRYDRVSIRVARWHAVHAGGLLSRLVRFRLGRVLVLGQSHGRPARLTPEYARARLRELGTCPDHDRVFEATLRRRIQATTPLGAPVTVAFGTRDFVLLKHQSRHVDQLPPGSRVESLRRCGHVPIADDPEAVTALILRSAFRAAAEPAQSGRDTEAEAG